MDINEIGEDIFGFFESRSELTQKFYDCILYATLEKDKTKLYILMSTYEDDILEYRKKHRQVTKK